MCLYHVSCGVPGYVAVLYVIYLHKLLVPLYVTTIVLHVYVYMFDIYYIDACNK